MTDPAVPAGWYPHPTAPGWEAYWTGSGWGAETRPAQVAAPAPAPASEAVQATEEQPVETQPAEPQVVEPQVVEPQVPEPQAVEPEVAPAAAQAQPVQTDAAAQVPESQVPAEPQVPESQPVESRPVEPQAAATVLPAAAAAQTATHPVTPQAPPTTQSAIPGAPAAQTSTRSDSSFPVILCVLGAVVAIVGSFLPAATADFDIADNTMVAAGYGIAVIAAAALGAIIAAYCYVKGARTWLPILLGAVVIGIAVYAGTKGLDDITPEFNLPKKAGPGADDGSPSTGIFAVGAGGLLMLLGGIGVARKPS